MIEIDVSNMTHIEIKSKSLSEDSLLFACTFVAVFFSSVIGAQIGPVSINTVALLPLLFYLLIKRVFINHDKFIIPWKNPYLWFCVSMAISSVLALFRPYAYIEGYLSSQIFCLIQSIVICIPLLCLAYDFAPISNCLVRSFVWTFRIHLIWAIFQYSLWTFFDFDLNNFFFTSLLGGLGKEGWTAVSNLGTANDPIVVLRVSGLNSDGAFLGIIVIIGIVLDRSLVFKILGLAVTFISMQRSTILAIVVMLLLFIIQILTHRRPGMHLPKLKPIGYFSLIALVVAIALIFILSPEIRNSVSLFASRFDITKLTSGNDSGTMRHLLYIPETLRLLIALGFVVALFGVGPKTSGLIFSMAPNSVSEILNKTMESGAVWTIESDFASVMAGCGFVGGACYLASFFQWAKSRNNSVQLLAITLFIFGLMYNFTQLMFIRLLFLYFIIESNNKVLLHETSTETKLSKTTK